MITNPAFGVCPERASGSLQNEIDQRNMKELIILSSFNQPFIPKIKKIHVDKYSAKIYMKQNNCGDTLHSFVEEYVSNYSTSKKLKFLSNFLCQMSCILQWLKLQGIAHMDIKPVNICIKKGNISLIDFGLASPVCENSPYYHGTMNYSDPSYLDSTKQVSFEYDMFAVGLICFYILNSKETKWKGWKDITQEELLKRVKFNEHKNKFSVGELDTLFSLINLDEKKRPTPEELYSSTLISDRYRNKYRLPTKSESLFYLKPKNNISIELNIYINKITNSKGKYLYSYSKMIMETLLAHSLPIVSNKELKYYCLGSIYIADMLLEGIIDLSEHISTEKLVRCVMDILIALNFKVFPDVSIYSPKA